MSELAPMRSEAINSYYAIYTYGASVHAWAFGAASGTPRIPVARSSEAPQTQKSSEVSEVRAPFARDLKDFGRLMTAMEVHGTDTYWTGPWTDVLSR